MRGPTSPANIAIQVIAVALAILQRDVQHNSVDNSEPFFKSYDYIVVGAGSAGCVVARRLSDDRHVTVLLLEAGPPQSFVTDLPGMEQLIWPGSNEFNWNYMIAPQKRIGLGRAVPGVYPEPKGLVVGGTSVINRMVYLRPNPRDFYEWERVFGAEGWSFEDVLPYFVRSENNTDYRIVANSPQYHGTDGPLGVQSDPNLNLLLREVRRGYNEFGIPTTDLNGPEQAGTNIVQLTIKDGYRSSTANAFIEPNPNPKNLFISANTLVTQVLFEDNGYRKPVAAGVEFVKNGHKYVVRANKEVILSAGSYNSPQLLMLSGIGPKDDLSRVGIPTLVDLPVGYGLQDHPMVQFWAPIYNNTPVEAFPQLSIPLINQAITTREGPLATSSGLYTYFSTKSNPDPKWPNIVLTNRVAMFSTNVTDIILEYSAQRAQEWADYFGPYLGQPYLVLDIFLRRILSRGRVRLNSADPYDPPIIDPNFLNFEQELDDLVEAAKFELYFISTRLDKNVYIIPEPIPGCKLCKDRPIYDCDSYIRCYITQIGDKEHHSVGTCRMGAKNRPDTVVDPRLRVKKVDNLRVCDSSVIPRVTNSNTNAVTIMIGEKCADLIREDNQH